MFLKQGLASDALGGGRSLVFFWKCLQNKFKAKSWCYFHLCPCTCNHLCCSTQRALTDAFKQRRVPCVQNRDFSGAEKESVVWTREGYFILINEPYSGPWSKCVGSAELKLIKAGRKLGNTSPLSCPWNNLAQTWDLEIPSWLVGLVMHAQALRGGWQSRGGTLLSPWNSFPHQHHPLEGSANSCPFLLLLHRGKLLIPVHQAYVVLFCNLSDLCFHGSDCFGAAKQPQGTWISPKRHR